MKPFFWGFILAAGLISQAEQGPVLTIPARGRLHLNLAGTDWKESSRNTPADLPPSRAFERSGEPRGSLEFSVLWSPKKDPSFTTEDNLRSLAISSQAVVRANALEKELPLLPLRGTQGQGFYFVATDRTYVKPKGAPVQGEYPVLTQGVLGVRNGVVNFTVLSDAKNDTTVREALAALRGATISEP